MLVTLPQRTLLVGFTNIILDSHGLWPITSLDIVKGCLRKRLEIMQVALGTAWSVDPAAPCLDRGRKAQWIAVHETSARRWEPNGTLGSSKPLFLSVSNTLPDMSPSLDITHGNLIRSHTKAWHR